MQVWGDAYLDRMFRAGLPSQLSDGNLRGIPASRLGVYEFYTTRRDECAIRQSRAFRALEKVIDVRFVAIDDILAGAKSKWTVMRHCNREAVRNADATDGSVFFVSPDQVWSDGSFRRAADRIVEGYAAVMCPGPRATLEGFLPALRERFLDTDDVSMPVPARELVGLGLEYLHPEMDTWFWDSPRYFKCPTYVMFDVPGQGVLAFCYILHPVVVRAQVRGAPFRQILDQDYLLAACPDISRIFIADDSDEVFHFEMTARDTPTPPMPDEVGNIDGVAAMAWYGEWQYNAHHREFAKRPIKLHFGSVDQALWEPVGRRGARIVSAVDHRMRRSDLALLLTAPQTLQRRIARRYRFTDEPWMRRDRWLWNGARLLSESSAIFGKRFRR
jgi:hypothetical protein